ncbi:MAG: HEAT repeat domain-containing protein [Candidatus Heimdallarchaeota archaeon]|nr:HEAT repeat domain-containing protein [Candidatus Heimdallarchaeota archaeon]
MNMREKMVEHLIPYLYSEDWRSVIRTVKQIAEFKDDAQIATKDLAKLLSNSDHRIRKTVTLAIKEIGPAANDITDELIESLKREKNNEVRYDMIWALGTMNCKEAIPLLIQILAQDENENIRQRVVESLGLIGFSDGLKAILDSLQNDPSPNVRYAAANSLRWCKCEQKVSILLKVLKEDENENVRASAAWSLGIVIDREEVIPNLINIIKEEKDEIVLYNMVKTLGELRAAEAEPTLIEILKTKISQKVKLIIIETLGDIGSKEAVNILLEQYKNATTYEIQNKIAKAIKYLGDEAINEFEKIKAAQLKRKDFPDDDSNRKRINKYRVNELGNILLSHNSISLQLLAGLLKFDDLEIIRNWLLNLPDDVGIEFQEDIDYDKIFINFSNPEMSSERYSNLNKIIANFEQFLMDI